MIITDRFIFIHLPKTGGTFVTEVLRRIHSENRLSAFIRRFLLSGGSRVSSSLIEPGQPGMKHGTCRQIPDEHRHKPIVSIVRNPFDSYVSEYYFRGWATHLDVFTLDRRELRKRYPSFPDLSFTEYVELSNTCRHVRAEPEIIPTEDVGWQSAKFVRSFFRNPRQVFSAFARGDVTKRDLEADMFPVHLLRQERLNYDLHEYLRESGYPDEQIVHILEEERIQPPEGTTRREYDWRKEYTPELEEYVGKRERLLLTLFPEYNVGAGQTGRLDLRAEEASAFQGK